MRVFRLTVFCLAMAGCLNANAQETDFETLDLDSDGKVTKDEFREYAEGPLAEFEYIDLFVDRVDVDGNKEISEEEFLGRMEHLQAIVNEAANGELKPEGEEDSYSELELEAKTAYLKIGETASEDEWDELPEHMTEKGRDDFCRNTVTSAYQVSQMQLDGAPVEELKEVQEAVIEVMEEYGLEDMELPRGRRPSDQDDEEVSEDPAEIINEALDKDGKRWEIVQALSAALGDSPLSRSTLTNNNVIGAETDEDAVFLTIRKKVSNTPGLRIQSPPVVIKMEKVDDKWLFAGNDMERSREKIQEFLQRRQRQRPQRGSGRPGESEF